MAHVLEVTENCYNLSINNTSYLQTLYKHIFNQIVFSKLGVIQQNRKKTITSKIPVDHNNWQVFQAETWTSVVMLFSGRNDLLAEFLRVSHHPHGFIAARRTQSWIHSLPKFFPSKTWTAAIRVVRNETFVGWRFCDVSQISGNVKK